MPDFWLGFAAAWVVMLCVMLVWVAYGYWAEARDAIRARRAVEWSHKQALRDHLAAEQEAQDA